MHSIAAPPHASRRTRGATRSPAIAAPCPRGQSQTRVPACAAAAILPPPARTHPPRMRTRTHRCPVSRRLFSFDDAITAESIASASLPLRNTSSSTGAAAGAAPARADPRKLNQNASNQMDPAKSAHTCVSRDPHYPRCTSRASTTHTGKQVHVKERTPPPKSSVLPQLMTHSQRAHLVLQSWCQSLCRSRARSGGRPAAKACALGRPSTQRSAPHRAHRPRIRVQG